MGNLYRSKVEIYFFASLCARCVRYVGRQLQNSSIRKSLKNSETSSVSIRVRCSMGLRDIVCVPPPLGIFPSALCPSNPFFNCIITRCTVQNHYMTNKIIHKFCCCDVTYCCVRISLLWLVVFVTSCNSLVCLTSEGAV